MRNILFCITGPSGSGKTFFMKEIMPNRDLKSSTTRDMRDGEVDGVDYNFIKKELFENMLKGGALAEHTNYGGNYYGLTLEEMYGKLEEGHAYFICDNNGFNQIKEKYDNIVSIFLYGDVRDCANNMFDRGDTVENVDKRLKTYYEEIANRGQYDYVVKNIRNYQHMTEGMLRLIVATEISRRNTDESVNSVNA